MNAKLLETLIKQWHQVAVKYNDWNWKIFLFINWDWQFQWCCKKASIEQSLKSCINVSCYSKQQIEQNFTNEYKVVTPAPLMLQPWDKVEILENVRQYWAREFRGDGHISMIWQKWLEVGMEGNWWYDIYEDNYKEISYWFPHRAVAKCEEEPQQEDKMEEMVKLLKEKWYKVIKE